MTIPELELLKKELIQFVIEEKWSELFEKLHLHKGIFTNYSKYRDDYYVSDTDKEIVKLQKKIKTYISVCIIEHIETLKTKTQNTYDTHPMLSNLITEKDIIKIKLSIKSNDESHELKCAYIGLLTITSLKKLNYKKFDLLVDFLQSGQDQIWQRALISILLVLLRWDELFDIEEEKIRFSVNQLEFIKDNQKVQDLIYELNHELKSRLFQYYSDNLKHNLSTINDIAFFQNPQNWFTLFFKSEHIDNYIDQLNSNIDFKKRIKILKSDKTLPNSIKYFHFFSSRKIIESVDNANINISRIYLSELYVFLKQSQFLSFEERKPILDFLQNQSTIIQKKGRDLLLSNNLINKIEAEEAFYEGNYDHVISHYNNYLELTIYNPQNIDHLYNRAFAKTKVKQNEKALEDIDKIINLDRNNLEALSLKGKIYSDQEKYEEALEAYNKLLELYPNEDRFLLKRGNTHFELKLFDKVIIDFNSIQNKNYKNSLYYYRLSVAYNFLSESSLALNNLSKAINILPNAMKRKAKKDTAFQNLQNNPIFQSLTT